jgi:hypothetical protein
MRSEQSRQPKGIFDEEKRQRERVEESLKEREEGARCLSALPIFPSSSDNLSDDKTKYHDSCLQLALKSW